MNQHRWTHATIVVLTTVLAPIANVCAQTSAPVTPGTGIYPQRPLPIITPLTFTELETDVAVPKAPAISSLGNIPSDFAQPIAAPVAPLVPADSRQSAVAKPAKLPSPPQISSTKKIAVKPSIVSGVLPPQNPQQTPVTTPVFAIDNPGNSFVAPPGSTTDTIQVPAHIPTAPIGEAAPLENQSQAFTVQADSKPLLVIRRGSLRATKIINTATIQAEVTRIPQSAPSIKQTDDIPDKIGFEAGTPTFVFDSERPQQIIATAIAQVGDTTVAPEPSIAIPVQRPNQPTIPTQSPLPAVTPIPAQPTGAIQPPQPKVVATQTGQASWYGIEGGPKTANGERYNPEGLTAAHRTLPFGTKVRVTSLKTGLAVTLRINDRGPFHSRRILDVSAGAAAAIGIKNDGIGEVKMEILGNEG
jgi:rare lipoprotein A